MRHFANGGLLTRSTLKHTQALKIGIAELGSWNDNRSGGSIIRHLSTAMDEFAPWDGSLRSVKGRH